ncbi:MAG TPA: lipoyl synthase [Thermoanaerobaculia bacterium]|nr:lipoyl synthase [Thermoanaerobaculia bacterium]
MSATLPSFSPNPDRPEYGVTPRPPWLKVRHVDNETYAGVLDLVEKKHLNTVCQEARCPNIFECWGVEKTATFMLMGDVCTRRCGFCAVTQGVGRPLDPEEPRHVAEAVSALGVKHAVVTSVNRDELPDGGAAHFAATIREIRRLARGVTVEVLIPDFLGDEAALAAVLAERPEVLNHNTETVERLYRRVRPDAIYARSLELLARAARFRDGEMSALRVKSGVMVGLGETKDELLATLRDLRAAGADVVTIGQYLQPHAKRLPIERYYAPEEFEELKRAGEKLGFSRVESGPLVRSSYHARAAL